MFSLQLDFRVLVSVGSPEWKEGYCGGSEVCYASCSLLSSVSLFFLPKLFAASIEHRSKKEHS